MELRATEPKAAEPRAPNFSHPDDNKALSFRTIRIADDLRMTADDQ